MVFDGGSLPAKQGTGAERRARRQEALARGKQLLEQGRAEQADAAFAQSVDITPDIAHALVCRLRCTIGSVRLHNQPGCTMATQFQTACQSMPAGAPNTP